MLEVINKCQPGAFEPDKWLLAMKTSYIGLLLFYHTFSQNETKYCGVCKSEILGESESE